MTQTIYDFLLMLDKTGFAYAIFLLCFLIMADYYFKAQEEVVRLRKILKKVARS
jgi:DMSO/TMAO reductase YedYZ heme-binding membrane subunit